jgi:hypothetical protein
MHAQLYTHHQADGRSLHRAGQQAPRPYLEIETSKIMPEKQAIPANKRANLRKNIKQYMQIDERTHQVESRD